MHRFTVDLKTFLGLAMPNQCCHAVKKVNVWLVCRWDFLARNPKPIYSTTIVW